MSYNVYYIDVMNNVLDATIWYIWLGEVCECASVCCVVSCCLCASIHRCAECCTVHAAVSDARTLQGGLVSFFGQITFTSIQYITYRYTCIYSPIVYTVQTVE